MKDSHIKKTLVKAYEYFYEKKRLLRLRVFYRLRIMHPERTIRYIQKSHCSIARFGDGEFDHILDLKDEGFQNRSPVLKKELENTLACKDHNLLLCVPRCMNTIRGCNLHAGTFWIEWGKNGHHEEIIMTIRRLAGRGYLFGDAQITRPYIDWKSDKRAKRTFPMIQCLWEDRDIIILEGEQTRMGVGNDLFDNARSVKRILCPAINAFGKREEIIDTVLSVYEGELIIMALGPTASVLAVDFSKRRMQSLDVGNIDVEYEWFLRRAKGRIPIPNKYTNEAKDGIGRTYTECRDEKYLSQIIARVGC